MSSDFVFTFILVLESVQVRKDYIEYCLIKKEFSVINDLIKHDIEHNCVAK